jgi:hypothetical protein
VPVFATQTQMACCWYSEPADCICPPTDFGWCPHLETAIHETFGAKARHAVKIGMESPPILPSKAVCTVCRSLAQLPIKSWITNKGSEWTPLAQGGA